MHNQYLVEYSPFKDIIQDQQQKLSTFTRLQASGEVA